MKKSLEKIPEFTSLKLELEIPSTKLIVRRRSKKLNKNKIVSFLFLTDLNGLGLWRGCAAVW